jgi:hypothetical protein
VKYMDINRYVSKRKSVGLCKHQLYSTRREVIVPKSVFYIKTSAFSPVGTNLLM